MFSIDTFDREISAAIVRRGKEYFANGAVSALEETDGTWSAEVSGTDDYRVEIQLDGRGTVTGWSCDCPYDGSVCKHAVAVCFAVRKERGDNAASPSTKKTKNSFASLLDKITRDEYRDFILRHAAADRDFKAKFELAFSNKSEMDVGKKYGELIRKIIRRHSDRGFLDYRATIRAAREIGQLIRDGEGMIAGGNFTGAVSLAEACLKELPEVIGECDDSSGELGGAMDDAIALLDTCARSDAAAIGLKEQIYTFLEAELQQDVYFNSGDFGQSMFGLFRHLAIQLSHTDGFVRFVDKKEETLRTAADSCHHEYRREFFLKQKIGFCRETGREDMAEKLELKHLDIVEIRRKKVCQAMDSHDFRTARQLINDGIRIAESRKHPGTVSEWQKELLHIAVLENDTDTVRQWSLHFAFDCGRFSVEYYRQWKQTYSAAEWPEIREKLIADRTAAVDREFTGRKTAFFGHLQKTYHFTLAPIYIEEQMWDRLLPLVQSECSLGVLARYHDCLARRYPAEMLEMYLPAWVKLAAKVSSRSEYATLAGQMQKVMRDIPEGKIRIRELARTLIAQHPRRPAMIDELKRVLAGD
ncbi:MAG: SWIM zinc finger family protein [Tannerella sp.]|nr:SWIM zinc finger family protein [Tannerella sp.]